MTSVRCIRWAGASASSFTTSAARRLRQASPEIGTPSIATENRPRSWISTVGMAGQSYGGAPGPGQPAPRNGRGTVEFLGWPAEGGERDGSVHGCAQQPPRRRHGGRRRRGARRGPAGTGAPRRALPQLLGGRGGRQGVLPGRGARRRRRARGAPRGARPGRRRDLPRLARVMEAQQVGTAFLEALTK